MLAKAAVLASSLVAVSLALGCNGSRTINIPETDVPPDPTAPPSAAPSASASAVAGPVTPPVAPGSIEDDQAFLEKHGQIVVLESPSGGRVLVSPTYQGRVMTSAVEAGGKSLGFVFRKFIEDGKTGTQFDNYGGEDRFWLGPEGGQFGLYFAKDKKYVFSDWQTPADLQTGTWAVSESSKTSITFTRHMKIENHSGTVFELDVERKVRVLTQGDAETALGGSKIPEKAKWVAFETENKITNVGQKAWSKKDGAPSIWILAMFNPSPDTFVAIPYDNKATGPLVNDKYFGKVPDDRLKAYDKEGFMLFKTDANQRGKIGLGPKRAKSVLGSFSASSKLLTLVKYDGLDPKGSYVNSMWEQQANPFSGDVVNSYNDGPTEPGKPSLGGFYEIESSSPAAELAVGASLSHTHTTFHLVGESADLDPVATKVLGVTTERIAQGIK